MNTPSGAARVRKLYGQQVVLVPYVMPGFDLAKVCIKLYAQQAGPQTIGMVLMNHGLFTWGHTAKQSYDRMIDLVSKAENYLKRHKAWNIGLSKVKPPQTDPTEIALLRQSISRAAGSPMIVQHHTDGLSLNFVGHKDVASIARRGPATPDHVIRTKRVPQLGRDVTGFMQDYRKYFQTHAAKSKQPLTMLDPAPRVVLDAKLGVCTIGKTAREASIAWDVYRQTMEMIVRAEALEAWKPLGAREIFEVEYWDLEQAKLKTSAQTPMFQGEVMLVTGAASGIGLACARAFLARGAAVVGLDLNPAVKEVVKHPGFLGLVGDISSEAVLRQALAQTVAHFGGLDMLVLNAGIFPSSQPIGALDAATWRKTMQINLDANLNLMREAHPLLKLAPQGGRVVVIASKNVPAPGPGAAAYSASKAALTQLARVAALEWGTDNIRVNVLHPNAVFDTGLWTDEVLAKRAASYKQSVEEYKRSNVLKTEVTSHHVAELAADLCGPSFSRTTGAQIPIDGGNDRVI
jgi:NAD(P)-dependent dehydrogenase (short-subunit alcohol dehydrogenase family)/ribulose-5-phosphate 4-epimerase/fuculose-1-phosphate aldolase